MKKVILFVMLISLGTFAEETPADPVDQRQENQEKRIEEGKASGQLTEKEEHRLKRRQHRIEKAEKRAEADGTVTPEEAKKLKHMQNRASREIYRKKHNKRK
ncbi:MAG: hypothetical protein AABY64_01110 [Bdellovibrionota bacterium]